MKKVRNSNIELLRIISMVMIVLSHYTVHNGINNYSLSIGFNRFLLEFSTLGNIGTIIFILITGYYSINKDNPFSIKKLLLLIGQVLFYSICIYIIFVLFGLVPFSIKGLIQNAFPITFKSYWFMTAFIVLYIFTPFINALLNKITEKEHKKLCIIGTILFILLSTLTTKDFYGNELIQFILFYNIGAYFGKYNDKIPNTKKSIILLLSSILIIVSSIFVMDLIGVKYQKIGMHSTYFLNRNSIIALLLSLSLFFIFIKMKPAKNIFINHISKYVLGIYLISDNPLIRNIIWKDIFKNQLYVNSNWLPLHMLLAILIIFLVCVVIDFLRAISIEKIYIKIINKFRHTKSN